MESDLTQHTPLLATILRQLVESKLSSSDFPCTDGCKAESCHTVVVFFVGGVTYEESKTIVRSQRTFFYHQVLHLTGGFCADAIQRDAPRVECADWRNLRA